MKIDLTREFFPLVGWFAAAGKFSCPTKMLIAKGEGGIELEIFCAQSEVGAYHMFCERPCNEAKLLISVVVQT